MASVLQDRPSSRLGKPRRSTVVTPDGSPSPWFYDQRPAAYVAPGRSSLDHTGTTRSGSPLVMRGARDMTGFSTPQRVTLMGREHALAEFRTPQHPVSGTNNWGGASPLLSRNIPTMSLETNYLKFNPLEGDGYGFGTPAGSETEKDEGQVKRRKRDWVFGKFGWKKKDEKVLGSVDKKKSGWFLGGKLSKRWPQGW